MRAAGQPAAGEHEGGRQLPDDSVTWYMGHCGVFPAVPVLHLLLPDPAAAAGVRPVPCTGSGQGAYRPAVHAGDAVHRHQRNGGGEQIGRAHV